MDEGRENSYQQKLLWLDCIGGLVVGAVVLLAAELLSQWDGLPIGVVRFVGFANLAYGSYSIWVATRNPRSISIVKILALANMAWLVVCIAITATYWNEISVFGVIHLIGEGLYVASLGAIEWTWRESLAN